MNIKRILIIGNGPSALNYKYGEEINKFKTVARINNYQLKGYEKYIGNKTDVWINGANQNLKKRMQKYSKIIVSIPSSIISAKKNKLSEHVSKRLRKSSKKFDIISFNDIQRYENYIGHKRLTTGTTSILWGLDNFENVFIHGFDFFINSKSHYYDSKFYSFINNYILHKGYKHDNNKERIFIQNLIKEGKIKRLVDNIK